MVPQVSEATHKQEMVITWEALPNDFRLEDDPVDNTSQPKVAAALSEILEQLGFIKSNMLIASNFGLCAKINGEPVIKAPDWLYIPSVKQVLPDRKSYTPYLDGDVPAIVIEFLSETDGGEYSSKRSQPVGKWFFYEQVLQVPIYVIFDPDGGLLEFHELENGRYELKQPDENGRNWVASMGLFLGTWQGTKQDRTGYWLRWWDEAGNLLPWGVEATQQERQRAEQERQRAEQESQRAEQERQQKERLAAYLKSQGIDPDNLPA